MRAQEALTVTAADARRAKMLAYWDTRRDLPETQRQQIIARVVSASAESIRADHSCVGKHWYTMSAVGDRSVCPYCGWKLTLRRDGYSG